LRKEIFEKNFADFLSCESDVRVNFLARLRAGSERGGLRPNPVKKGGEASEFFRKKFVLWRRGFCPRLFSLSLTLSLNKKRKPRREKLALSHSPSLSPL